jgi:hypothetical protein
MDGILIKYFKPTIDKLAYSKELNSYLLNLLVTIDKLENLSKNSLTLKYIEAQSNYNFNLYQSLGDWILFCQVNMPEHLKNAEEKYYNALAQNSYYHCYIMLKRQWKLFEELADMYPNIVKDLRISVKRSAFHDAIGSRKFY